MAPSINKQLAIRKDATHHNNLLAIFGNNPDCAVILPATWFNLAWANQYCARAAGLRATTNALVPETRLLTGHFTLADQNADLLCVRMLGGACSAL